MKRTIRMMISAVLIFTARFVTAEIALEQLGTYSAGIFNGSAAEIAAYDPATQRLFVANGAQARIDVLDISNPESPSLHASIDVTPYGADPTSVDVYNGMVAVAIVAEAKTDAGTVALFDADGMPLTHVAVGALPDMLAFTPNGKKIIVANEGEPSDDYTVDPEGSISIINLSRGLRRISVETAHFRRYNGKEDRLREKGVRIFGPNASAAQDFEPEYITVSDDSRTAYVTLQENNAIAVVDIKQARVTDIIPLGFKQHLFWRNAFDASDRDNTINIRPWQVRGMYLPDGIASYTAYGKTFLITANEGDSRDYDGFSEEERVEDITLHPYFLSLYPDIQEKENLGRLKTTAFPPSGKTTASDGTDVFHHIYSFGARSFSIWTEDGRLVYDSGSEFEEITASFFPANFNSNNEENNSFDNRSDDKGPEPENVVLGVINGHTYAFIGLERMGGIMIYDVTNPFTPHFSDYVTNRNFDGNPEEGTAGGLAPEGILFIPANQSPTGVPLLVVSN
ncbi:choice-of-anchor I family protein, partial [bacterium]|nr:choice-of-anchor I family protein [bacterium]